MESWPSPCTWDTCRTPLTGEDATTLLLEHAKAYYDDVIETQTIVRDKAKLLLGATSFTIAVFALATALLKDSLQAVPWWGALMILLPLIVIAVHFVRALVNALVAITRESTNAVSTQEVVDALISTLWDLRTLFSRSKAKIQLATNNLIDRLRDRG
jgi:hypothetical protein